MSETVTCPLCFRKFRSLMCHIVVHKMSVAEFRQQFPAQAMTSDATKERISVTAKQVGAGKWRKGSKLSPEHKAWLSQKNSGAGNPFFGKHHTDKTRTQMIENHADISGDKNPFRKVMKDEEFKTDFLQRRKDTWENIKQNDPERYARKCESASKSVTQAILDGKLLSYGKGHKHSWITSLKAPEPIYCRSSYEIRFLELCDLSLDVRTVTSVPFSIQYMDEIEHPRRYIPDFIINDNVLIEVKARFALNLLRTQRKHEAAKHYCEERAMQFFVITSPIDEQFGLFITHMTEAFLSKHG